MMSGGRPLVWGGLLPLVDSLGAPGKVLGEGGPGPDGVHANPDLAVALGAQGQGDAGVGPLAGDDAEESVGEDLAVIIYTKKKKIRFLPFRSIIRGFPPKVMINLPCCPPTVC